MATPDTNRGGLHEDRNLSSSRGEEQSSIPNDLPDSPEDQEKLKPEVTVINLPDVADIPGQENITVPHMESFADTTIASADEEGDYLFSEANEVNDESGVRADDVPNRDRANRQDQKTEKTSGNRGDSTGNKNSDEKARTAMGQDDQPDRGLSGAGGEKGNVVEGTP